MEVSIEGKADHISFLKRQKGFAKEKTMTRKTILKAFCLIMMILLCCSCTGPDDNGNYPYEPDTPAPDPHEGVFISDWGMMTFNGDGESITITVGPELAELFELPQGEYSGKYVFLSGDLPPHGSFPIRYDVAHELQLDLEVNGKAYSKVFDVGIAAEDGSSGTVGVDIVTPERIPLLFRDDDLFFDVIFTKE